VGLLCNNYRDSFGTYKYFGATTVNGASPYDQTGSNNLPGGQRNIFASQASISLLSAKPAGARHPVAWLMPQKPGGLASRNATTINLTQTGLAVLGLPATGSTTITFDATGTGGLIAGATGTATITFSQTGVLASVATISGSTTITFTPTALLGALAGLSATGTITLTPTAISYAVGYMSGLSTNETEFSASNLANAVWQALAASYNDSGTMGAKLNSAASAGDPWSTSLPGTYTGDQAGKVLSDVKNKTKLIPGLF
jgi:hypothetical protein